MAMTSPLNLGERHLLPTYPALFILAGGAAGWLRSQHRWFGAAAVAALLVALGAESIAIRPHYLAYFNVLAGGPESGYRHLVDSSLDWGQDLPGLKRWLEVAEADSESPLGCTDRTSALATRRPTASTHDRSTATRTGGPNRHCMSSPAESIV